MNNDNRKDDGSSVKGAAGSTLGGAVAGAGMSGIGT